MLLLRHGETPLSVEKRFSGRGDPDLTDRGRAQAKAAVERLAEWDVEAVVSSPLARARRTAEAVAVAAGVDVVVDDALAETDFGAWEGHTFGEIAKQWPDEIAAWLADPTVAPPQGESFAATFRRVRAVRDRLVTAYPGRTVVVVSHVTPIKSMLRDAVEAPPQALYRIHLDPASLSQVDWYADGAGVVRLVNDTGHLGPDLTTTPR
jgi:probable phosphoglycerate mutase